MLSFSGFPLLCSAVLLLMGVSSFSVIFLGIGFNSVLFPYHCILLLLSFTVSLNQVVWTTIGGEREVFVLVENGRFLCWWRTGGFCVGGRPRSLSERLHEVSLDIKIVADRGWLKMSGVAVSGCFFFCFIIYCVRPM